MFDLDLNFTDVQKHNTYNLTTFPTKVEFDFSFVKVCQVPSFSRTKKILKAKICVYVLKLASWPVGQHYILAVQGPA